MRILWQALAASFFVVTLAIRVLGWTAILAGALVLRVGLLTMRPIWRTDCRLDRRVFQHARRVGRTMVAQQ